MFRLATLLADHHPGFRRWGTRLFYQSLARWDAGGEVTLMNYGYVPLAPDAAPLPLDTVDEKNRLCLQLYHAIAGALDLRDKDVLEVGSGRGGGAAYVNKTFSPRSMTGVDYVARAVAFCQATHRQPGLNYVQGDAEALPFEDARFERAINVESSHGYGNMRRFLEEVHRVLCPGGSFSWADMRQPREIAGLDADMRRAGFETVSDTPITDNVLASMAQLSERNRALIDRKVPPFARPLFYRFAGVQGTGVHDALRSGELVYLHRVLVKPG